jgi:hypothetical protein
MGLRGENFSTRVALQNRTYFFNVKENRLGDLYLNIVESKNRESGGFERQSVILFADDLTEFLKGFDESLRVLEKAVREQRKSAPRKDRDAGRERGRDSEHGSDREHSHDSDREHSRDSDREHSRDREGARPDRAAASPRGRRWEHEGGREGGREHSKSTGEKKYGRKTFEEKNFGGKRFVEKKPPRKGPSDRDKVVVKRRGSAKNTPGETE